MNKEIRAFNINIRSIPMSATRTIIGRPIVFNSKTNLGWYDEIIEPGALDRCNLDDVRFLVNHDKNMIPLARYRKNSICNTMTLTKVSDGLNILVNLDVENNSDARKLVSALERKDISGMSFSFIVDKDKWDNTNAEHPTRHILSIKQVFEVSAVTFPAYEQTTIQMNDSSKKNCNSKNVGASARKDSAAELELAKAKLKAKLQLDEIRNKELELAKAKAKAKAIEFDSLVKSFKH